MRGSLPHWALVFLGVFALSGQLPGQHGTGGGALAQNQADASPFAEETRQIEAATDKAARRTAFAAVLKKATGIKVEPEPLVSILRNRKPEETFAELLAWIKDTPEARVRSFLPVLITTSSEAGDAARPTLAALREYGFDAVDTLCTMLDSSQAAERVAAISAAGKRIGGLRGAVKVIPHLVRLANEGPEDLESASMASLRKLTYLEFKRPEEWKTWLGEKTEAELSFEVSDSEHAALKAAQEKLTEAERKLQQVEIDIMVRNHAADPAALVERLYGAQYLGVQVKAADLLGELLPSLAQGAAAPAIEALGTVVCDAQKPDELRIRCVAALARAGSGSQASEVKAALAFAYIDRMLGANGVSSELRLELVKALNTPEAASRLAEILKAEIDNVQSRSGTLLEAAIVQVSAVLRPKESGPARDLLLGQLSRLLDVVAGQLAADNLPAPARKRFVDLAVRANDALQNLARLREIDLSLCLDSLLRLARIDSAASGSALTALRQAVNLPAARENLREKLASAQAAQDLAAIYERLREGRDEPLLVNVLGIHEVLALAPEPLVNLRAWLIEQARASQAKLPGGPELRLTRRDAVRALVAKLNAAGGAHAALVHDLMECEFGDKDALVYLQLIAPPRAPVVINGLSPHMSARAVRVAMLVQELLPSLSTAEKDSAAFRDFRDQVARAARKEIAAQIDSALAQGVDDGRKAALTALGNGPLREQFVVATVDKLREKPGLSEARDAMVELLLGVLKQAHPGKYDAVKLKGHEAREFEAAIDNLKAQLKIDGYAV